MKKLLVLLSIFTINIYAARAHHVDGRKLAVMSDVTTEYAKGQADYHGNVVLRHGGLTIYANDGNSRKTKTGGLVFNLTGSPATFERIINGKIIEGRARHMTYYKNSGKLVLSGNVGFGSEYEEVVPEENQVLVYNINTNDASVIDIVEYDYGYDDGYSYGY